MSWVLHRRGEGERHTAGPTAEAVIKAAGEETAGTLFFAETRIAAGFPGPPLHRHRELHDLFYVLDGALTLRLGDESHELGPGDFACVPPGVAHTFSNPSDAPVRFLNVNTPAGWEHYMRELGEAGRGGPLTPEAIGRIASRHDFEPV